MNHTQYLLRFDDICPTMNWRVWSEIEAVLVQRRLKPLLAVVPDNRDPGLQVDAPAGDFWDRVREWQDRGWPIALHGYQHLYTSRNAGMVALRKKSEFAGLPASEQRDKLGRGAEIFERERITPRVWIAPGDTFDATTVALLPEFGIRVISAGYCRFPFVCGAGPAPSPSAGEGAGESGGVVWVPQQLYRFRPAPPGVWTVCYHHNQWSAADARKFREDMADYGAEIVSLDEVLNGNVTREGGWSAWLCLRPRLSRVLIRAELKVWSWCNAGRRRRPRAAMNAVPLSGER